jgi:hypothetical protein
VQTQQRRVWLQWRPHCNKLQNPHNKHVTCLIVVRYSLSAQPACLYRVQATSNLWLHTCCCFCCCRSFSAGAVSLNAPGSIHQVYTDRLEGCTMLILYSKDCTFIRATGERRSLTAGCVSSTGRLSGTAVQLWQYCNARLVDDFPS